MDITARLFEMQDTKYREFQLKLIPNISAESCIGVRTPAIRELAKELHGSAEAREFLDVLPHRYFDENSLHGSLINLEKDFDTAVREIEHFLPHVDNWSTCDQLAPKAFAKHTDELLPKIREWVASGETYTVRFGIEMLMSHFLGERFTPETAELVASVQSEEYYVNMMIAWYFATALAKQYSAVIGYITEKRLSPWVHNKTIQKAVESRRITDAQKTFLRTLKL